LMPHSATQAFLFRRDGVLYRQVNQIYAEDYTRLIDSGLYAKLVKAGLLIRIKNLAMGNRLYLHGSICF